MAGITQPVIVACLLGKHKWVGIGKSCWESLHLGNRQAWWGNGRQALQTKPDPGTAIEEEGRGKRESGDEIEEGREGEEDR